MSVIVNQKRWFHKPFKTTRIQVDMYLLMERTKMVKEKETVTSTPWTTVTTKDGPIVYIPILPRKIKSYRWK